MSQATPHCFNDRKPAFTRRAFLKTTASAGITAAATSLASQSIVLAEDAAKRKVPESETLVAQLYSTLTDEQKRGCAFSFDHPLRQKVDNNWLISKARVGRHFSQDQQALIRNIFMGLHSPEYAESVIKQVEHDTHGQGISKCAVALFGEPGSGKFEFVLTGRHVTRRCDGDSIDGTAFGGPIFYGHAAQGFNEAPDHPGNIYWYQAKRANELFGALDGRQRQLALRIDPRAERQSETVKLRGEKGDLAGVPVRELTADQRDLARKVMTDVLAPFREVDRTESMKLVETNGFDKLHFSYYKNMDIGSDGVWDVWQIEGPAMLWYFRGSPHVHTWVHIRASA